MAKLNQLENIKQQSSILKEHNYYMQSGVNDKMSFQPRVFKPKLTMIKLLSWLEIKYIR